MGHSAFRSGLGDEPTDSLPDWHPAVQSLCSQLGGQHDSRTDADGKPGSSDCIAVARSWTRRDGSAHTFVLETPPQPFLIVLVLAPILAGAVFRNRTVHTIVAALGWASIMFVIYDSFTASP